MNPTAMTHQQQHRFYLAVFVRAIGSWDS